MSDMERGIYEVLLTDALRTELRSLEGHLTKDTRPLHTAEAADRIALYLSRYLQQALESVSDSERVRVGIEVARDLIARIAEVSKVDHSESPSKPGEVLHAIVERLPDGRPGRIAEPLIPLLD